MSPQSNLVQRHLPSNPVLSLPLLFPNRPPSRRSPSPVKPPVLVWSRPPVQLELFPWMKPNPAGNNPLSRASLPAWFDPSQLLLPRNPLPPA
jgi:hypothetical protein